MPSIAIHYLRLLRAPALFTAGSNILAAYLIVNPGSLQWPSPLPVLMASLALYSAGMVLNDCFDFDEDCRERPNRPLPSGRIALKTAWLLGWLLLSGGLAFAAIAGKTQFAIALILALTILLYNGYAKHYIFGVLVMGGCRYLNWLLGLSLMPLSQTDFILALPVFIYVCSLTLLSRVETSADKKNFVILSFAGMLMTAGVLLFILLTTAIAPLVGVPLLLGLLVLVGMRMLKTYRDFSPAQIQKTMKFLIMGIIPLDALVVFCTGSPIYAGMILLLLFPGWLLGRSMSVT